MPLNPSADIVFADGPLAAPYQPQKPQIRRIFKQVEQAIDAFSSGAGSIAKASKSQLDADLAHAADVTAWVYNDSTVANNGIYRKASASGAGSWTRILDLPFSFIIASNAGTGTANALQATTSVPTSPSGLVMLNVTQTSTSSPVTVSFNGGPALTIKSNSGVDVSSGGLVAGMVVLGVISGSTFRLVTDDAVASQIFAARDQTLAATALAQNARDGAVAAKDIAAGYASDAVSQGNVPIYSSVAGMTALNVPQGIGSIRVNGFSAAGDAGGGLYVRSTAQPTGEYAGLAFRSADRFLPDGSTSSTNGGWWEWKETFDMRQVCQKIAARLGRGDRTVIACYDDSTGDGNNTTGWTANPTSGQSALGNTDHSLDAPNAWPARLAYNLSNYYRGEDLKVLNCGYSGKRIYDGWAYDNALVAVIQNSNTFAGKVPDIVIVGFGINDASVSSTDPLWMTKYISETRRLCRYFMSFGVVPVLKTCDPNWRSDPAGYDSFKIEQMVNTARTAVAQELGLTLLDVGSDLKMPG